MILWAFAFSLLFFATSSSLTHAQGTGIEWETPLGEAMERYCAGNYDRAIVLARKALEATDQHVGPNHPHVATSLENLLALYGATKRSSEAEGLEQRTARREDMKK